MMIIHLLRASVFFAEVLLDLSYRVHNSTHEQQTKLRAIRDVLQDDIKKWEDVDDYRPADGQ